MGLSSPSLISWESTTPASRGFYGSGAAGDPNQGFQLTPNGTFIPENFRSRLKIRS